MKKKQENVVKHPIKGNFKGVWIPRKICLNGGLTAFEQKFISMIFALSNSEEARKMGGCYANNGYLATVMSTTQNGMARMISDMKKRGLIETKFVPNEEGEKKRVISIAKNYEFSKEDEKHYSM